MNDVQVVNINGSDCLTASLWITGVDGAYIYSKGNGKAKESQNVLHALRFPGYCWP